MKNNNMEIITSYLEGRKAISITVATQSKHIRRIIPLEKAVRIREGFDEMSAYRYFKMQEDD